MPNHSPHSAALLYEIADYITRYVTLPDPDTAFILALWVVATHLWPEFDTFPYLTITSDTKRSGKTRLTEVLSFLSANAINTTGASPASIYQAINAEHPTLFFDEAESLTRENADLMHAVLNTGYRRGQTIMRGTIDGGSPVRWSVYCPKVFALIGDVYDTLRDRSIIIRMRRAPTAERFVRKTAELEGHALRDTIAATAQNAGPAIIKNYQLHAQLEFLNDRDGELWMPLFAVCETLAPEMHSDLTRVAVDMAIEKTAPKRRFLSEDLSKAEEAADNAEYGQRLLSHLGVLFAGAPHTGYMATAVILAELQARPEWPWRRFRGTGLTDRDMARLLSPFGVRPKGFKRGRRVQRGYAVTAVHAALARNTLTEDWLFPPT